MSGNISLLIFSFIFICIIIIYLHKKWPDLDVIDLYIVFALLHFGFVPFIRGLYFGKDIVFDFRNSNPLAIGLVFGHILVILLIIKGVSLFLSPNSQDYLKLRYLIQKYSSANKYLLLVINACLVLFPIISYYCYGVKPYIMPEDFDKIGHSLPYWFTSIRTIYNYIAFCVLLGLFGNMVKAKKYPQIIWITLIICLILSVTINGRRFLLNIIVIGVIFWFAYNEKSIWRLRYLTIGLLLIGSVLLFSNMYQSYRDGFLFKAGQVNFTKLENPISTALNYHATINNLKMRAGTWEFNFLVFNFQINKSGMTTNGNLTWDGFKSSIPRFFWPGKQFRLIDDYLAEFFRIETGDVLIAKNIFGIAQLDFGYLSIIIIPAIILFIIGIMGVIISKTMEYPTFLMLFTGNILWYLVNFEESGNEIFFMFRNMIMILLLFALYILTDKIYTIYRNYKMGN